jgi:hypothetical protein
MSSRISLQPGVGDADSSHVSRSLPHMRLGLVGLAFLVPLTAISTVRPTSGAVARVTNHVDPIVSPDGRLVAYTSVIGNATRGQLVVMTRAGKQKRVLGRVQAGRRPAWSPDGRWIAYANKEIYVVSPTGRRPKQLSGEWTRSGDGPVYGLYPIRWLDDRTIEYEVSDCCFLGGVPIDYTAIVTLDGKQVDHTDEADCAYRTDCAAHPVSTPVGIRDAETVTHPDGSKTVQLSGPGFGPIDLGPGEDPSWVAGNRYLVWLRLEGSALVGVVADPNGSNQHELVWNGVRLSNSPGWSPDGSQMLLQGPVTGKQQIFLAQADGSDPHPVTSEPNGIAGSGIGPYWSPSGRWIIFTLFEGQTLKTVALARDGTGEHVLVRWRTPYKSSRSWDDAWTSLAWTRDEATAVYDDHHGTCHGTAVYRLDATTGRAMRLTNPC